MATDAEEFIFAVQNVCDKHERLQRLNPDNKLLSLIILTEEGFNGTKEYQKKYVKPHLKNPNGQLCLWDGIYKNQFEARLTGLLRYISDLYDDIHKIN